MKKYADGGIYTAEMGPPPMEPDGGSASPRRTMPAKPPMRVSPKRPMMKKPAPQGGGIFREGMQVPQDIDGGSAKPFKKGGSVGKASSRADGIVKRGKTRGKII